MGKIKLFLASWHGNVRIWSILAFASAFWITFYTTDLSIGQSLFRKGHLTMLGFSFVLMFFATGIIGLCVYWLDTDERFRDAPWVRWLVQAVCLLLLLPNAALHTVYYLYQIVFGIDLQQTDYYERDFVVVVSCIMLIQVYFWGRGLSLLLAERDKELQDLKGQLARCLLRVEQLENERAVLSQEYRSARAEDVVLRRRLHRWRRLFKEIYTTIELSIENKIQRIPITELCYLTTDREMVGAKIIHAYLNDGRVGTVNGVTLKRLHEMLPLSIIRISRFVLLFQYNIDAIAKEAGACKVYFVGGAVQPLAISEERGSEIRESRSSFHKAFLDGVAAGSEVGVPEGRDTIISARSIFL